MQLARERVVAVVKERSDVVMNELQAAATVAAAFSALSTAHLHAARSAMPLSEALDAAMEAVSTIS